MKVGDLVREGRSGRVGIVVEIHHRVVPTAVVRGNGIESTLAHRQDLLEVISESR